jgi:NADPH:quinone reductase-like Zn-dependent oxidoreductase
MLAAFHAEQGSPAVLQFGQLPDPVAGRDEVLVRAKASSLDRVDIFFRTGSNGMRISGAHIGGRDVAGTVEALGPGVAASYPGLEVGQPVVGVAVRSAHAELVAVPAALIFPLPETCTFEQAAAIPTAGRTAYDGLMNRGRLSSGETALVVAGSSGVGSFGVQIAKAGGARVITTVGSTLKAERAAAIGADAVIDHYAGDVALRLQELTDGRGVDVVLDPVGAATFPAAVRSLARDGRYVTTGVTAGHRVELHLGRVFERGLTVTGVGRPSTAQIRGVMLALLALVADGAVVPVVQAVLPLRQIADAHRMLEGSEVFGKIVLTL